MPSRATMTSALLLSLAMSACQPSPAVTPAAPGDSVPVAATPAGVSQVTGRVMAPADWLISTGSGAFRVRALAEAPMSNAQVVLVDERGQPVPGVAAARTNAQGEYTFDGVPSGRTYRVLVTLTLPSGQTTALTALVTTARAVNTSVISLASTLAANLVLRSGAGSFGHVSAESFGKVVQAMATLLEERPQPASAEDPAFLADVDAWVAAHAEVSAAIDAVKEEMKQPPRQETPAETPPGGTPPTGEPTPAPATPVPSASAGSGGSGHRPDWRATLSIGASAYEGLATPIAIVLTTTQGSTGGPVQVKVASATEPAGELVMLQAGPGGVFTGSLPLVRRHDAAGEPVEVVADGKLAVYADAHVANDPITVTFGDQTVGAAYTEPATTLTGVVMVGGVVRAHAQAQVIGPDNVLRKTASRADGTYAFYDLPSGTYALTFAVAGAQSQTKTVIIP